MGERESVWVKERVCVCVLDVYLTHVNTLCKKKRKKGSGRGSKERKRKESEEMQR